MRKITEPLSEERKGEIALALVRHRLRTSGLKINGDLKREIINRAQQIDVDEGEAIAFAEELIRELVDEVFPPEKE